MDVVEVPRLCQSESRKPPILAKCTAFERLTYAAIERAAASVTDPYALNPK